MNYIDPLQIISISENSEWSSWSKDFLIYLSKPVTFEPVLYM